MQITDLKVKYAWQFNPQDNKAQPDFAHVQTALGGPRAIIRPPISGQPSVPGMQPVILYLAPSDWVVELSNGAFIQLNAHAAMFLLDEDD